MRAPAWWARVPDRTLAGILLLGLGLRLWRLTFHSLWLDEAVAVNWARLPAAELWARTITLSQDSHPPLYYLTLHTWMRLLGDSEIAVRLPSALCGLALVAFIYLLGKALGGRRVGLMAALLAAVSPYLVWYSQEVRMYMLLGLLSTAGFYCLWQGLESGAARWWAGHLTATVAGMYTQVIGSLLLPVHALVALLFIRQPRRAAAGLGAVLLAALAFIPLAITAWGSSAATSTERVAPTIGSLVTTSAVVLLLRQVPGHWQMLAVPGVVLLALGIADGARRDVKRGLALALYIVVMLGLIYVLSVWRLPIFGPPYIIVVTAPLLVAVALGLDALWRRRRAAGMAALLAVVAISLFALRYNWDHSMGKEDWRSAAHYLATHARQGDVVLTVPDYARIPLTYYYRGDLPLLAPFGGPVQPEAIAPALTPLDQFETVWLVWSHGEQIDPAGQIRRFLMERYPVLTEQYPRGVEIRALAARYRQAGAADAVPLAIFGGRLRLLAAESEPSVEARDEAYHPPSGWVHVQLAWQRVANANLDGLRLRVRVTDSLGQVWGERLERETEVWRVYPPQQWQPDEAVRDAYDVNMNPATPPGRYRLEVQVLQGETPLPVQTGTSAGDCYVVSEVEVR